MSDLPQWIQAAAESTGTATALWLGIKANRQRAAEDWAHRLKELSQLDEDDLRTAVESSPVLGEIIYNAWDAAARSASKEKRLILARVAAHAIRGDEDAQIEALPYLVRAVAALEPTDIRLLVTLARPILLRSQPSDFGLDGAPSQQDLTAARPEFGRLLAPMLATLQREGLIADIGKGTYGGAEAWALTSHGRSLLRYLDPPDPTWLGEAEVVARFLAPSALVVKNIGLGSASQIDVSGPADFPNIWNGAPPASFDLQPAESLSLVLHDLGDDLCAPAVHVSWRDVRGQREREVWLRRS